MFVLFIHQTNRTESDTMMSGSNRLSPADHLRRKIIQHWFSPAIGHPTHRILNLYRNFHMVDARIQHYRLFDGKGLSVLQRTGHDDFGFLFSR